MSPAKRLPRSQCHPIRIIAGLFFLSLFAWPCRAQAPADKDAGEAALRELNRKYPGLLEEFGNLFARLQSGVPYPAPRTESHILPLLPEGMVLYGAIPNYGDAAKQTLIILREEVENSAALRDWIQKNPEVSAAEPQIEDALNKISQLHQYLGKEIVFSGTLVGHEPVLLVVSEIHRPGLRAFLERTIESMKAKPAPGVRLLDPQELAIADEKPGVRDFLVLVRPDFVVASTDLATVKNFNARLERPATATAVSGAFRERIAREYQNGVTVLAGADLQKILSQAPPGAKYPESALQRSGFSDVKYLVWDRGRLSGQDISQMELSFNGPRQGAAAWLANSRPLTNLDFVSPKAVIAGTVVLTDPAQLFEDIKNFQSPRNQQNAFTALAQFERVLKLSLRDDVLANLTGELTVEVDDLNPLKPKWKVILAVKDSPHVQQTLATLLKAMQLKTQPFEDSGVSYNTVQIPMSGPATTAQGSGSVTFEATYTFADGHLLLGSSREGVVEAIRLHRTGESLAKSKALLAALPPGHSAEASALLYQDPVAVAALQLRRFMPEMADSIVKQAGRMAPSVVGVYADDFTIREASSSSGFDLGAFLVAGAVAIPNLRRSRTAANEASAVGTVRTIMVAQVTYAAAYPKRVYAPNLRALGPDPSGGKPTPQHAELVDESVAGANCGPDGWCTKYGYRFNLTSDCQLNACNEYVVTATPLSANAGIRSFCTESDGIIRTKTIGTLLLAPSAAECRKWVPLE